MDLQKLMDAISDASKHTRSEYHLTLDGLIKALEGCGDEFVTFDVGGSPSQPHSYRGYYSDLSFERVPDPVEASRLLEVAKNCVGRTFEGWKGGDFVMDENTPLWTADEGSVGLAMMGISYDGSGWVITTKDV